MSLHFQCFALLPQALTQSPQQGRPAADHMARLPDQVMTWSHNMYSLSPSSLRQCPPRFTRHVLQRFHHTIVNWLTDHPRPPTAAYRSLQRASVLVFMRVFYFLWKNGSEIGVSLTTSWAADITLPAFARVRCVHLDITITKSHRRASDYNPTIGGRNGDLRGTKFDLSTI